MNIRQSQMTRTLGSPKIIRPANHHSANVYFVPYTLLRSLGIQVSGYLCPQAIFLSLPSLKALKLEDSLGKDETGGGFFVTPKKQVMG